jgi:hypothetical protein
MLMGSSDPSRRRSSRTSHAARSESPQERAERLRRIQQMIADGTYETEGRWNAALDQMFASMMK